MLLKNKVFETKMRFLRGVGGGATTTPPLANHKGGQPQGGSGGILGWTFSAGGREKINTVFLQNYHHSRAGKSAIVIMAGPLQGRSTGRWVLGKIQQDKTVCLHRSGQGVEGRTRPLRLSGQKALLMETISRTSP